MVQARRHAHHLRLRIKPALSSSAVDCSDERGANLLHSKAAQPAHTGGEAGNGGVEHRIQLHYAWAIYRIVTRLETDFGGEAAVHRAARNGDDSPQAGDGGIPGQYDHRSPVLVGNLAPPDFAASR